MIRRKNERFTNDADRAVKDIKRQTRRRFSSEDKIRIVLVGLRGDDSIAELCRQEGIAQSQYYPASEKIEIIKLVEQSHLPAKQTLDRLGIPRSTFYLWYDKYLSGGVDALEDKAPMPTRVWNRITLHLPMSTLDVGKQF